MAIREFKTKDGRTVKFKTNDRKKRAKTKKSGKRIVARGGTKAKKAKSKSSSRRSKSSSARRGVSKSGMVNYKSFVKRNIRKHLNKGLSPTEAMSAVAKEYRGQGRRQAAVFSQPSLLSRDLYLASQRRKSRKSRR